MPHDRANPKYISTTAAARALGVSVSTIKRWVDESLLPAQKTAGGHRRLIRPEVLAMARSGDLPHDDSAELLLTQRPRRQLDLADFRQAFQRAVVHGDAAAVRDLVRRAYLAGLPLEALADQVISPVMQRVGHDWENKKIEVWHEHRGTFLCASALFDLQAELSHRAQRKRPVAIGGAPEGDPYLLATLLAQLILLDAGWDAVNLGPNTPMSSFLHAVETLKPQLIWLSVSHLTDVPTFVAEYQTFERNAVKSGAAIAVGGRALTETVRSQLRYTSYGDRLAQLAAFARVLHPRPQRPRRGRPRMRQPPI